MVATADASDTVTALRGGCMARRGRAKIARLNRRQERSRRRRAEKDSLSWMGRRWKPVYDREADTGAIPPNLRPDEK